MCIRWTAYESLEISDRGYVLAMGINKLENTGIGIINNKEVKVLYLGDD